MAIDATSLDRVHSDWAAVAQNVDSHGDGFKVGRIDARFVLAEMIDSQSGWDGADELFVGEAVSLDGFGRLLGNGKVAVPTTPITGPEPAVGGFVDVSPEADFWRVKTWRGMNRAVEPEPPVMHGTKAVAVNNLAAFRDRTCVSHCNSNCICQDQPSQGTTPTGAART